MTGTASLPRTVAAPREADGLCIIGDAAGFDALVAEWPDLLARCEANHPFNTHAWFSAWRRHFGRDLSLEVLGVWKEGRLVCCLPMALGELTLHGRRLRRRTLWVNTHSFRSGLLCDARHLDSLDAVARHLAGAGDWDILDLPYLPRGIQAHGALVAALGRHGIRVWSRPGMVSPRLAIQGSWDDYLASLSRSRRESVRRMRRRALEKSGATVEITHGRPDDLEARLEACWRVSARTWKHRQGSSIAADPVREAFYRQVALDPSDWLVLGLMHVDGQPVAFEYDLLYGGVLHNLKLGFDEAFERLAPGLVLRGELLRWAHDNGVGAYDYMGNAADYKTRFASETVEHDNVRLYNRTLSGRLLHLYEARFKPVARRVRGRLPGRAAAADAS